MVRVAHVTGALSVLAGGSIVANNWNGRTGGIVALRVDGALSVAGVLAADACGFRGGEAGRRDDGTVGNFGVAGEGISGLGTSTGYAANGSGGGGGETAPHGAGGGGGGGGYGGGAGRGRIRCGVTTAASAAQPLEQRT